MPRKKTNHKPKINKSAFVRGLSATMPANEVVQKARAAGIKLTIKHVYVIRSKAKVAKGKRGHRGAGRPSIAAVTAPAATVGMDTAFASLALDIGLVQADALVARLRRAAHAAALG